MSNAQHILRLGLGFIVSQALRVVVDLKIPDLIGEAEQRVDILAVETNSNADALYRVLRVLASEGVFRETAEGYFALTELGATLRSDIRAGPRDFIRMMTREPYRAFAELDLSVRTGMPAFKDVFGAARFDWLAQHPEEAELFQRAMAAIGEGINEAIAEAYDFQPYTRVVDVGGGHGRLLSEILARNAHISGVLFDRPTGVAAAMKGAGGPLPRTEFVSGDFFESVPLGCDVYLIKKVIHDWDDDEAVQILRNCCEAMRPGGKVLILETIVPPGNEPDFIKLIDANMLVVTGGKERTEAEYSTLCANSGLRLEGVIETAQPISILEAVRA